MDRRELLVALLPDYFLAQLELLLLEVRVPVDLLLLVLLLVVRVVRSVVFALVVVVFPALYELFSLGVPLVSLERLLFVVLGATLLVVVSFWFLHAELQIKLLI